MGDTSIEWTDATWNPVRGCSRVSPGCVNCYAEKVAARFCGPGLAYEGLARRTLLTVKGENVHRGRWTGEVRMVLEHLADPLRWAKPRRIFVNSMSDLFHEKLSNEEISAVFGVMAAAPHHTFQVLTKCAARMREWFEWAANDDLVGDGVNACVTAAFGVPVLNDFFTKHDSNKGDDPGAWDHLIESPPYWPLPNVHLGVSVESQDYVSRVDELLRTPAARRFVSYEPALGPLDGARFIRPRAIVEGYRRVVERFPTTGSTPAHLSAPGIDWLIVGGESGPGARPFDLAWAHAVVSQCVTAGCPVFVKQMGANVTDSTRGVSLRLRHKKGADMTEWPESLRVRQFPEASS